MPVHMKLDHPQKGNSFQKTTQLKPSSASPAIQRQEMHPSMLTQEDAMVLQCTIGNEAFSSLLEEMSFRDVESPKEAPIQKKENVIELSNDLESEKETNTPTLQLFQAQIIASEDKEGHGVIQDIKLSGRTPSPFPGTMGAHSTAWIVHTDGVRRQLQGLTLDQAIEHMKILLVEIENSAQMKSARTDLIFTPFPKLMSSLNNAKIIAAMGYTGKGESKKTMWLEDFIDVYLDIVNYLPMAAAKSGDTKGHDEADFRQPLIMIEGGGEGDPAWVREQLTGLFAKDTPAAFTKDMKEWGAKQEEADAWTMGLQAFLRGLRHAYPRAFMMAQLDNNIVLTDFLRGISPSVPADIFARLNAIGEMGGAPVAPHKKLLEGATGDIVGGDLAVQIRFSAENNIEEIRMEGRTPSPFVGSMGAHSTAWIAHLDGLRGALRGRTLPDAIGTMLTLSHQAQTSPLLSLVQFILPDQARLLARSQVELQYFQRVVQQKDASELILKSRLQQFVAAYLQFNNALPLHTAEAANTDGHGEPSARKTLLSFENGELRAIKAQKGSAKQKAKKAVSIDEQLEKAFWKLYDRSSVNAFTDNLFPTPVSVKKVKRNDGRASRSTPMTHLAEHAILEDNSLKSDGIETAYKEKPLADNENSVLEELKAGAEKVEMKNASLLLPQAMAFQSFLHTMAVAYPRSYARSWGDLDKAARSRLILIKLQVDGGELLGLMEDIPEKPLIKGDTKVDFKMSDVEMTPAIAVNVSELMEGALKGFEQGNARRDGIAAQYRVGHASGTWNACLIYSLLRHALDRDATDAEVLVIRNRLRLAHPDIENERQIGIYTDTGHAVIQEIEAVHHVSLNVAVVTTREAPVVPVKAGRKQALLYLMPGHYAPCWEI